MSDLAKHLADVQDESELQALRLVMKQMRDFLAGALCAECGDVLGHDEEIVQDEDGKTVHKDCEVK